MPQILLHGILQVTIFEADLSGISPRTSDAAGVLPKIVHKASALQRRKLLKRFSWVKRMSFCRPKLEQEVEETMGLGKSSGKLYATVDLQKARVARTRVVSSEPMSPRWYETFHIYCAHELAYVVFTIKADDPIGASLIGRAYLPVEQMMDGKEVDRWLAICDDDRKPPLELQGARIHVRLQYLAVSKDPEQNWGMGIASRTNGGVPRTFFPQRTGCKLKLYHDAHVAHDQRQLRIPLEGNQYYEPGRCWEDIFDAISNARHLIYIIGWSVYPQITLVRERNPKKPNARIETTLGELLKSKAQEGVRVLMLVWDDRTSVGLGPLKRDGVMATHDQDTLRYFSGSKVHCVLCPRNPDEAESLVQDLKIATMFTHHQKTLVVDGDEVSLLGRAGRTTTSRRRSLRCFLGGIDLCDGRYDTQQHSLFQTLGTVNRNDFHQPNFPGATIKKGGPREPWHDTHCLVGGPVAWDVLHNFEQRWRKQGSWEELLLQKEHLAAVLDGSWEEDSAEAWNIQLFRSIDGGALVGFPETPEDASSVGLVSGKNHIIERSIQDAYIHAIRRAKNFIYIENQYFVGSSFSWKETDGIKVEDIGALNLIPKELSLKVISKIQAGERFAIYIVVPMWPEGVPESASVQAILDWQHRTIQMMYADVAEAIRAKGLRANPQDYLNFFCLGNRQVKRMNEYVPEEQPEYDTDYYRAQQARRFMIYVHSKMMIVDDEYIIVGSANINQRSMDGGRDTEIAIGAYQPSHLAIDKPAEGQIYGFRLSLWYEHLGMNDKAFLLPQSLECVQKTIQVAERNWKLYASDELNNDLPSHLLRYPVRIDGNGEVTEMPGMEFFPDTRAKILGSKSEILPAILTT